MTIGTCPACSRPYAAGAETCPYCGEPLTSVARVLTSPSAPRQPRWLQQNRQRALELRQADEQASGDRMQALVESDRRRLEAEHALAARTQTRERRAMLLVGLVFALIAALALGVVLALIF